MNIKNYVIVISAVIVFCFSFVGCQRSSVPAVATTDLFSDISTDEPFSDETFGENSNTEIHTDTDTDITTDFGTQAIYPYDKITDPSLYEPVPEDEYGLSENDEKRACPFELSGTAQSATGTSLNLILQWKAYREEGDDFCTFEATLGIEHKSIFSANFGGSLVIDGKEYSFMSPFYDYKDEETTVDYVCPIEITVPCKYGESYNIEISAKWNFNGTYDNTKLNGISFNATIPVGEKYAALKQSVSLDVDVILQEPELPEGCEVTSLAMILNYLGFDVSHTYLSDKYLPKGTPGKVSFYEYNVGNPRNRGQSWGCYSPVILKTANKYLSEKHSTLRAFNYTGYDINEIYYQLSMGHPVIVWVTMGYLDTYTTKVAWNIDGKLLYWKYPLHCVVLSGYDMQNGTVTITDPQKETPQTVDMKLFELRFRQMESQAIVVKESRPIKKSF